MKTAKDSKKKQATTKVKDLGAKKDVKGGGDGGRATFPGGDPRRISDKSTDGGLPQV
jgi:hypothetical protein